MSSIAKGFSWGRTSFYFCYSSGKERHHVFQKESKVKKPETFSNCGWKRRSSACRRLSNVSFGANKSTLCLCAGRIAQECESNKRRVCVRLRTVWPNRVAISSCDVPTKQFIQYLNELKPVDKKFIIQDLDSTHLLIKHKAKEEIEREIDNFFDQNVFSPVERVGEDFDTS